VTVLPANQVGKTPRVRVVVGVQRKATVISVLNFDMSRLGNGSKWDILSVLNDLGQRLLRYEIDS